MVRGCCEDGQGTGECCEDGQGTGECCEDGQGTGECEDGQGTGECFLSCFLYWGAQAQSGWTTWPVLAQRTRCSSAPAIPWGSTTVCMRRTPVWSARVSTLCAQGCPKVYI